MMLRRASATTRSDVATIEPREEGDPLAVAPPREEDGDEDHPRGRELHREAGRPLRLAEEGHRGRDGPVVERGLLEVAVPVQARRDEVPRREHLARDLGVARLVGLEERGVAGLGDEERDRERRGAPRGGRARRPGGARRGTGSRSSGTDPRDPSFGGPGPLRGPDTGLGPRRVDAETAGAAPVVVRRPVPGVDRHVQQVRARAEVAAGEREADPRRPVEPGRAGGRRSRCSSRGCRRPPA